MKTVIIQGIKIKEGITINALKEVLYLTNKMIKGKDIGVILLDSGVTHTAFLTEVNGDIIGIAYIAENRDNLNITIENIFINKKNRYKGYGTKFIQEIIDYFSEYVVYAQFNGKDFKLLNFYTNIVLNNKGCFFPGTNTTTNDIPIWFTAVLGDKDKAIERLINLNPNIPKELILEKLEKDYNAILYITNKGTI